MIRLLVLALLIALVAFIVVKLVKGAAKAPPQREGEGPPAGEAKLVRCTTCGAFVPRGDALPAPDGFRCAEPACRENVG